MLTVQEALTSILAAVAPTTTTKRPLAECLDHVLSQDLITPHDSPPFDKSMMDGFAVHTSSFDGGGTVQLSVQETITAGTVPQKAVVTGVSSRIMTGAALPAGADCVVPIEQVSFDAATPGVVSVATEAVAPGKNILQQGHSAREGTPLMATGTRLQPQHIAVLAEFGVANVPVHRQPAVAILATGDELLDIDQPLTPGHIRNSNEPMLHSQIRRAHALPIPLGVAKDTRDDLRGHIQRGLEADFLILSGGVSAGTLDLVPSELNAAGVAQVFHKIQMKPGKPLWFGQLKTDNKCCYVFGLPGNPVSSMICFELFVRPALRQFCGVSDPQPQVVPATLQKEISVRGDRVTYLPTKLQISADGVTSTPVPWGGSADLRSTAEANGMSILHPQNVPYPAGHLVDSIWW